MAQIDLLSKLNKTGSGVDLKELATSLVEASISVPKQTAQDRLDKTEVSISAIGTVRSQLLSVQSSLSAIAANDVLSVRSSSGTVGTKVTDRNALAMGETTVGVLQVAKSQVLEFTGFSSKTATLPAGKVTLDFGAWYTPEGATEESFAVKPGTQTLTLNVSEGTTLETFARQIDALYGLTAAVLDKGDGTFSLGVLTQPGAGNAIRLTVEETTPGSGLARFDTTTTNSTVQAQAAQNAVVTVNGIQIFRETNTLTDVVPGMELTISQPGTSTRLTVSRDQEIARTNLMTLVEKVNAAQAMLTKMTARETEDEEAGDLAGNAGLQGLKRQLDSLIRRPIAGYGDKPVYLTELGLRTQQDGSLTLNAKAFEKAFADNPSAFDAVFSNRLTADDEGVSVVGVSTRKMTPGVFSFQRNPATAEATMGDTTFSGVDMGDGRTFFTAAAGEFSGLILKVDDEVASARISYGKSFLTLLDEVISSATANSGTLDMMRNTVTAEATDAQKTLTELDTRAESLKTMYAQRFGAMEAAVTRFNSTSSYLDSLVAQWNKNE
ncbi:flagellar hook-associated protein 2 [Gemmobacter lanyuensis]|uniref:Flagellar hook-associated protein 2 n=1 Tax=Gemmobacter lanyuensis TaxID=1054497 RepID=A0A918MGV8_9RHOB|nr:flagellar filament capping protein FliD [Gemmobacter lanyuensis]GGW21469.1 flagellar hook-associated protein 2 [Gemmobacter lanyuensis]